MENVNDSDVMLPKPYLDSIRLGTNEDDIRFEHLHNETVMSYALEQYEKQLIYGISYIKNFMKEKWSVPYKEYRSTEEIEQNGYFTQEEKNRITEENYNLIYSVVEKYKPSLNCTLYSYEDILEACMIGFTNALNNYNKVGVKAKFTSYAYQSMANMCMDFIRKASSKGKKDSSTLSFDYSYRDSELEDNITLADIIKDEVNHYEILDSDIAYKELCEKLLDGLDAKHRMVACFYYGILGFEKKNQFEISLELHINKKIISDMCKKIEEHFSLMIYKLGLKASDIL